MKYLSDNIYSRTSNRDTFSSVSRYRNLSTITDDEGDTYIETAEELSFPERSDDSYHIVTAKDSNRLDLIADQYYRNPLLYWVIAIANDIYNPLEVPEGTTLRIPSKQSLYGYKGVLA